MAQTTTRPTNISQVALDFYNSHYQSQTFSAFSAAAAQALGLDERVAWLERYDEIIIASPRCSLTPRWKYRGQHSTTEPAGGWARRSARWTNTPRR